MTLSFGRDGTAHYTISALSAEHLRKMNVDGFRGASLGDIQGYGMPSKIDLQVRNTPADTKNVENLWYQVLEVKEAAEAAAVDEGGEGEKRRKKMKKVGKKSVFRPLTDG